MIDVTLLGTGGMLPKKNRWLSSCLISCAGHSILIDCGEGTQIALKYAQKKTKPIDLICITHFHADHISGLPGFLLSMGNEGRTEPVTIAGPSGIEKVVHSLCIIAPQLPFEIKFIELNNPVSFTSGLINISFFDLRHSIECIGYTFELPRPGKFDTVKAEKNNVPKSIWSRLQKEGEVLFEDRLYTYDMVSSGERRGIKLAYCTDTKPCPSIIPAVKNADLLICEGLYYGEDKLNKAADKGHMIFSEAATIANEANVHTLWLTHFSPALETPEEGIDEARKIFAESYCGYDGMNTTLSFSE